MKPFKNYILPLLLLLVFTGSKAQILYNRAFGTSSWDAANDIIIGYDNNYMLYGNHYKNLYLAKADTTTQLIWEKSYPVDSILLYPSSICEIGDSSYVMAGQYQNVGFLLKINTLGDSLFSLNDSILLGNNVTNLKVAPDGNLLALVYYNQGFHSLLKLDDELNVINRLDTITPEVRGFEVVNNTIYVLKNDSLNNLLLVDNNLSILNTISLPFFPYDYMNSYLRVSYDKTQLILDGRHSNNLSIKKRIYTDLLGNIVKTCDSLNLYYTNYQTIDATNNILHTGVQYNGSWGPDIKLYFINNQCEQVVKDTILYRGGSFSDPWAEEKLVKILVDVNGNYVLYGNAEQGPLGDWDIFLMVYKKWDGFPTGIDDVENDKWITENKITIYPNPTQNQFTVTGIHENSSITVMDVMGKVVYQVQSTTNQTQINTTNWAKGLYIVQLKGNQSSTTLKVIKQ